MTKHIILLLLLSTIQVFGQKKLTGKVLDNDNNPLNGAIIQIFDSDTAKIIDYSISGSDGIWEINNIKQEDIIVEIKYLGYKTAYHHISNLDSDYILPDIVMFPENHQLQTVSINAKKIKFLIKGDTISYNVDYYRDTTDFYLEDILQRIPELEIKEDKQIWFKGEKVDKVLVEGKDLYDNKHQFFLQSFAPKDIDKVEIIQNYKDLADRFNESQKKKTALNIKLKDKSKGVIKLITETAGGYKNKNEHNTNFYYVKNRIGFNSFFKTNNRGESDLNMMDFLRLNISKLKKTGTNLEELIPPGFNIPIDLTKNRDIVAAINIEEKLDKKRVLRFSVLGAHLKRFNSSDIFRTYLNNNTILQGENNGQSVFRFIDESFSTDILLSKTLLLGIKAPVRYINSSYDSNLKDIEQIGIYSVFNKEYKNIDFAPNVYLSYKFFGKFNLKLNDDLSYFSKTYNIEYNDTSPDTIIGFYNTVTKNLTDNNIYLSLTYKNKNRNWIFQHYFNTISNSFSSESQPSVLIFRSESEMQDEISKTKVQLYNKFRKFVYSGNIEVIERHKREINGLMDTLSYFNGKVYLGYEFSLLNGFGISFSYNKTPYSFEEVSKTYFLTDNRTLIKGIIPFNKLKISKSFNANYFNFESVSDYKIFGDVSYSNIENPIIYNTKSEDGFFVLYKELGKQSTNISGKLNIKRVLNKLVEVVSFNFDFNKNFIEKNNSNTIKFDNYNFKLHCDFKFSKSIKLKTGYHYSVSSHSFENKEIFYSNHKLFINLIYKNKKIKISNEFRYETNFISQYKNSYLNWNTNMRYMINSHLALYIKGKDILNFHGKEYKSIKANDQFIDIQNYIKFPGYILFGIHYSN